METEVLVGPVVSVVETEVRLGHKVLLGPTVRLVETGICHAMMETEVYQVNQVWLGHKVLLETGVHQVLKGRGAHIFLMETGVLQALRAHPVVMDTGVLLKTEIM